MTRVSMTRRAWLAQLVQHDEYGAVNAMLLNEFIKARRQIDSQQKQIDALAAGLQKVSAELELSKAAPQTVSNDH